MLSLERMNEFSFKIKIAFGMRLIGCLIKLNIYYLTI